ncbi:unnamed protein product [Aphanomyces euteiches]|uniref:Pseudouridine synthase RsuA/RluA-like domain-containing protein n=1 Tax=Aphanomyces euteiches TaxID=100861 RepID=A0A6G0WVY7_9STRA|nr:hypothetical protein Ae201684_011260 [Aphanomyces euteiches]KAH9155220.1 hypothetical protein AeRB84_002795 [Aphanomyces euteiches]
MGRKRKRDGGSGDALIEHLLRHSLDKVSEQHDVDLTTFKYGIYQVQSSGKAKASHATGSTVHTSDVAIRLFYSKLLSDFASATELATWFLSLLPDAPMDMGFELVHVEVEEKTNRLVFYTREMRESRDDVTLPLDVLYEDSAVVVVNKPYNLPSVDGVDHSTSLHQILKTKYPHVRIVHRLDMETSGIMVAALTLEAAQDLNRQFRDKTVQKTYEAVITGTLSPSEGVVELPLAGDPTHRVKQRVDMEQGKPSKTLYTVKQVADGRSRVELTPVTGRTHQLRVHMHALGHPMVGDSLYAEDTTIRLHLHAIQLEFDHPMSGHRVHFDCPCPF